MADPKDIVALVPDLFFSTKISETARHLGRSVQIVRKPEVLSEAVTTHAPRLVILDLTAQVNYDALLTAIRNRDGEGPTILAFTTHADWKQTLPLHPLCDQVVTKDQLTRELPALLQKHLG